MKELNEYRDEIFRRSAEKTRQIKKRRRVALGVGIPLCLCCVLTVALLPRLPLGVKGDVACDMEAVYHNAGAMKEECSIVEYQITDLEAVTQILSVLDGELLQKDEEGSHEVADEAQPGAYRMTLRLSDGSTLTYQVSGCDVYCETTAETRLLSLSQAQALYELVGGSVLR